MIIETRDIEIVRDAILPYERMTGKTDPTEWLSNEKNLAFTDGHGNVGLLRYDRPGLYDVHIFFKCHGRKLLSLAEEMIRFAFDNYPVEVMRGYTPLYNKAARWVNRQLGLKSYGALSSTTPPCELFLITKQEFYAKHGERKAEVWALS